jgi:hypothetical protein
MRDRPEPDLYELSDLINAGKKHLAKSELDRDNQNLISVIVAGSERFSQSSENE